MKDITIPDTKHVMPDDTFLAKRVTKGIEMAFISDSLLDLKASKGTQYQFDPQSTECPY